MQPPGTKVLSRGTAREYRGEVGACPLAMALSKLENEARRLLLERRHTLWPPEARVGAPPPAPALDRLGEAQARELAAIDEALGRIDEGRYGECLACGGPLGLQRIRAIPEARYCIACSTGHGAA